LSLVSSSIRSRIRILLDDTALGPITCGVFRPAIALPGEASGWDPEELRRAVIHELEHVRRADLLMFCVARIVCAIYWFHPLIWISWRRLRLEADLYGPAGTARVEAEAGDWSARIPGDRFRGTAVGKLA
jgi:beta-lactamase regulating signal transducer with metallopeptidase domain